MTSRPIDTSADGHQVTGLPVDDAELFQEMRSRLYTPVVGDILDALGRRHQFLPPSVRPMRPDMVVVGRAMPALIGDAFGVQSKPFGKLTAAIDDLRPGEVYIGRSGRLECAAWGELLTVAAKVRGAAGAVLDGFHRDSPQVLGQYWPVFSRGGYAQDAGVRSVVVDYRIPIEIDGVLVTPGDLVFGDSDGVLIIPQDVERDVLQRAFEKAMLENRVRKAIEEGMSSTEAFATFGVL